MDVYDSSVGGRARYLCDRVNGGLRGVGYLLPTEARTRLSPFELREGIIFFVVSIMVSSILPWKSANGTPCIAGQHVWLCSSDISDARLVLPTWTSRRSHVCDWFFSHTLGGMEFGSRTRVCLSVSVSFRRDAKTRRLLAGNSEFGSSIQKITRQS